MRVTYAAAESIPNHMKRHLLLLSNSRNPGEEGFVWASAKIKPFLGDAPQHIAFVPFAGVTLTWDAYTDWIRGIFEAFGHRVTSVHAVENPRELVQQVDAIFVGGGNTFHLVYHLYATGLMEVIRAEAMNGKRYMGWSAGGNITAPTLATTNDMPIIQPPSFDTLGLVPFQINPHYHNLQYPNHMGETRDDRLQEFIEVNPDRYVAGLPEGCLLHVQDDDLALFGPKALRVFRKGEPHRDLTCADDLRFLLENPNG